MISDWQMVLLLASALGLGSILHFTDTSIVDENCTFVETRHVPNPWGGGDHDVYECGGIEWIMSKRGTVARR